AHRQRDLDRVIEEWPDVGRVEGLAVMNGLIVWTTRETVTRIAGRDDVAYVLEEAQSAGALWRQTGAPAAVARDREPDPWWLEAIGAPRAWESGHDGDGIVVGIIDSGASASHDQTEAGYRGGMDSWYDPRGEADSPVETLFSTAHGTSLISLAVGRGGYGRVRGVAPGARWIAALGFPAGRFDNLDLVLCFDWMLLRGQPDIIASAWSIPGSVCDATFDRVLSALRAAEIFVPFAAGNQGPGNGTNRSPANSVGLYPGDAVVFSVGGTIRKGARFPETSEGPNRCDPTRVFPLVCAPADDLIGAHAFGRDAYLPQRGTSFSVALVAGAAALLLQGNPDLSVSQLEDALIATALDLGAAGPDDVFGHGQIRVDRAVDRIKEGIR
ncbi:MAG: S8 family serine peptidase, partial [Planctomycetota bacterium]|nr:S8 family serine peptidase [Planctomycetota bacterium]